MTENLETAGYSEDIMTNITKFIKALDKRINADYNDSKLPILKHVIQSDDEYFKLICNFLLLIFGLFFPASYFLHPASDFLLPTSLLILPSYCKQHGLYRKR